MLNRDSKTRQTFLNKSKASLALGLTASQTIFAESQKTKVYKVGLVGCGGRGSGAALNTLLGDAKVELIAMADVFEKRLTTSYTRLKSNKQVGDRVKVSPENKFVGFDAYKKLLETDVDIVILATPPAFRPLQLKAAVEANKHVFAEKPIAVDAFGVKMAELACEEAEKKKLFVVAGLQTRYEAKTQEMVKMIEEGAIGDIVSLNTVRYQGAYKVKHYSKDAGDVSRQIGNWLNYTWLSGDIVVELFVHEIDRLSWLMKEDPISCYATGGKQQPRSKYAPGQNYDHFSATVLYPGGVKMNVSVRQQMGADHVWTMDVGGSKGHCHGIGREVYQFTGKVNKELREEKVKAGHQLEHNEMYRALRAGDYINNGDYVCKSTLIAVMIREAAYTGKEIKWSDMEDRKVANVDLEALGYNTALPSWKEAVPGMNGIV